jgi:predicted PurR-regulated permease PerM
MSQKINGVVKKVDISTATFLKIIAIFAIFAFLYLVKEILALIFLALILSSAIDPWVEWLRQRKIPKTLSIITIYVLFIAIILTTVILVIPPMAKEIAQLASLFPEYYSKITSVFNKFQGVEDPSFVQNVQVGLNTISSNLLGTINGLFNTTAQVFGGFFSFITVLILAFYFAMEENAMKKFANSIIPKKYQSYIVDLTPRIQKKLGQWFRGQLTLSLIIFGITFLALVIFNIKYALILALLAGVFEIIPYFGPWIAGAIAVLLTFTQSPIKALIVAIIYLVVQQLENSIIVPKVIGKSVGLNPIVVMIGILIGFKLVGVVGGLIAVPIIAAISVFVTDVLNKKDFKTK